MGFNKFEFKKFEPHKFDPSGTSIEDNVMSVIDSVSKLMENYEFCQMVDLDTLTAMETIRMEFIRIRENM